jgi:hypothetical protein
MNPMRFSFFVAVVMVIGMSLARAQGPADFVDIPWGTAPGKVREAMKARGDVKLEDENAERIKFSGGTFAGEAVSGWRLEFVEGKFRVGTVSFTHKAGRDAKGFFNDQIEWRLLKQLEQKYGRAKRDESADFRDYHWTFIDKLKPNVVRTIRLHHGWGGSREIELTYREGEAQPRRKGDI